MSTAITTMTDKERREYRVRKESIKQGVIGVAEDLKCIRDERLYREEYDSFEDFVRFEFEKTRQWAYDQIGHVEVLANVKSTLHPTVSQSHELATLPDEEQADAWAESQEKAESEGRDVPTTKDVKETVQKRKAANGGEYKPPKVDKPTKTVPVGPDLAVFDKLFGQAIRKYDECAAHYKWTDKREHGELLDAAGEISEKYAELVRGME